MRESLVALKLVLDELEVPTSIGTLSDRKLVQKAVFLAKHAGVDLGYSYGWYVYGPYSPALTRDYFALDESLQTEETSTTWTLRNEAKLLLANAKPLLVPPAETDLDRSQWAELVASLLYFQDDLKLDAAAARAEISLKKPHLVDYVDAAEAAIAESGIH